ncbi:MAG: DUF6583 family protein [Clostridia bacterium]
MKSNKKKIIIISIISTILVLAIVLVGMYFFTDIFKSNQTLFYEYAMQDLNATSLLSGNDYTKKIKTTPYTAEGDIIVNVSNSSSGTESQNNPTQPIGQPAINNLKLNIKNTVDNPNQKEYHNLTLKYGDQDWAKVELLKANDAYGVKLDGIINKYLAIDNNNLKEFAQKMGMQDTTYMTNKLQSVNIEDLLYLSKEDKQSLLKTYSNTLNANLSKDKFTKQANDVITINGKEVATVSYRLTLTEKEMVNTIIKVLETAKQDELTNTILLSKLQKLGIETDKTALANSVDKQIATLQSKEYTEDVITITVYTSEKVTLRTEIAKGEEKLTLDYIQASDKTKLTISATRLEQNTLAQMTQTNQNQTTQTQMTPNETNTTVDNSIGNNVNNSITTDANNTLEGNNAADNTIIGANNTNTNITENNNAAIQDKTIYTIDILKEQNNGNVSYTTKFVVNKNNQNVYQANLEDVRSGDINGNEINHNYLLDITAEGTTISYTYNKKITFQQQVEVANLDDTNCAKVNNYQKDYLTNLMNAIKTNTEAVLNMHLQTIALDLNSLKGQLLGTSAITPTVNNPVENTNNTNNEQSSNNTAQLYNSAYEKFQGNSIKAADVKQLLDIIADNNKNYQSNIIAVKLDNTELNQTSATKEAVATLKEKIQDALNYKVELSYDYQTGMVSNVTIITVVE